MRKTYILCLLSTLLFVLNSFDVFSQCTGCGVTITANTGAISIPTGVKYCIAPPVGGGNITITGNITFANNASIDVCTGPNDTVIFIGQFLVSGAASNTGYFNNYGNLKQQLTGTLAATWPSNLIAVNSGYMKIANTSGTTGQLTLNGATVTNNGTLVTVGELLQGSGTITNNGTITSLLPIGVTPSISIGGTIINNGTIYTLGNIAETTSGILTNSSTGYIHTLGDFSINGSFTNHDVVLVGGSLKINSGTIVNISNGYFESTNLYITKGGLTADAGSCSNFLVTDSSMVTNSPSFTNNIYIEDLSLRGADSIDNCSGCGSTGFRTTTSVDGSACPNPLLPVKLISFELEKGNEYTQLSWTTSTEENSDYFEVQKSNDGITFSKIGIVASTGHSSSPINYEFYDNGSLQVQNYYRLKLIDINGSYSYSKIINVNLNKTSVLISAFPNPAKDFLSLRIHNDKEDKVEYQIINITGESYVSGKINLTRGENDIAIDVKQLPTGIYFLKVISLSGVSENFKIQVTD